MKKIVILGIGNILFQDEGIGIYAAKYLRENYDFPPNVEVLDGGTLGFKLMTYYQEYDKVIILDTVSIKDTPGSVYNLPSHELMGLGRYRQSAHEVEVVQMLEICSLLDYMAEISVIGIVPKDIESVNIGLCEDLKSNFSLMVNEVLNELKKADITAIIKEQKFSLDQVIDTYANPTGHTSNA